MSEEVNELKREDLVRILKEYLTKLNCVYETPNGGEKHLAEKVVDDAEMDAKDIDIIPVRKFITTDEVIEKKTGITMTIGMTIIFSHVDAKKKVVLSL